MAIMWTPLIAEAIPELAGKSLEEMLVALISRTLHRRESTDPEQMLDTIEYYSGKGALTQAHIDICGSMTSRWDKIHGSNHDSATPEGLRNWLDSLSSTKRGALIWFGTQCSSFLMMTSKYSQRSQSNQWLGFHVVTGACLSARAHVAYTQ